MAYRVKILPHVRRRIAAWQLPDFLLVDVYLRLGEDLPRDAPGCLVRTRLPFDGMCYAFSIIDPSDRLRTHTFVFQILFSQDEERLLVCQAGYQVKTGL